MLFVQASSTKLTAAKPSLQSSLACYVTIVTHTISMQSDVTLSYTEDSTMDT